MVFVQEYDFVYDESSHIQYGNGNSGPQYPKPGIGNSHPWTGGPHQLKKGRQVAKGFQPLFPVRLDLIWCH
jgi:hypothetical protein